MSSNFELAAKTRHDMGKGASRRLRRENKIPAVLYGADKDPVSITLMENQLMRNLQEESFFSSIIDLKLDTGKKQSVILRDLQRHPSKPFVLHADLQRIQANVEITMVIPLHFLNEETAYGVKTEGGMLQRNMIDLEISCLPKNLPEFIEVDVENLKIGDSIHLTDLVMPEGVTAELLVGFEDEDEETREERDQPVVSVIAKPEEEEFEEEVEEVEGAAEAEAGEESSAEEEAEDND